MVCSRLRDGLLVALLVLGALSRIEVSAQALSTPSPSAVVVAPIHSHDREILQASRQSVGDSREASGSASPAQQIPSQASAVPDIAVVSTTGQLQEAFAKAAQNIEIRAHLDLRSLNRLTYEPIERLGGPAKQALFYVLHHMTSMRGNCTDPDPVAALGLSPEDLEAAPLLPLKPRQCLLLVPDSFLMSNGAHYWMDNLYLKLSRAHHRPEIAFVMAGGYALYGDEARSQVHSPEMSNSTFALTNLTIQSDGSGPASAVQLWWDFSDVLMQDCILSDWVGFLSPLMLRSGRANVVDTVIHNATLPVELADVSIDGFVRFENTSLARVNLRQGRVVSTTYNDYRIFAELDGEYYAADDAEFDVEVTPVQPGARGMFGAEFVIGEAVMSDCVFLHGDLSRVLPGCPEDALARRREMLERRNGRVGADDAFATRGKGWHVSRDALPSAADPWLLDLRAALGPLPPPPPGWPPFAVAPPQVQIAREGVAEVAHVPPGLLVSNGGIGVRTVPPPVMAHSGWGGREFSSVLAGVLAALGAVTVAAAVWAVLALRRRPPPPQPAVGIRDQRWSRALSARMERAHKARTATHATSVSAAVSGNRTLTDTTASSFSSAGGSVLTRGTVPQSVMNSAYEYALPTVVAALMVGPIDESADPSKPKPRTRFRLFGRGSRRGRRRGLLPPMPSALAATQPSSGGSTRGGGLSPNSAVALPAASAPLAGALALGPREGSLQARSASEESGSLAAAAPSYVRGHAFSDGDLTVDSRVVSLNGVARSPRGVRGAVEHATEYATRTLSTVAMTPAVPGSAEEVHGIRMGRVLHTDPSTGWSDWTEASAAAAPAVAPAAAPARAPAAAPDAGEGDRLIDRLQRQLDSFEDDDVFLGRFTMLGREHRRRGGQAVVQFAEDVRDHCDFAVKFFLDYDSFLTEAALYAAAFPHIRSKVSQEVRALAAASAGISPGGDAAVPMACVMARFLPQVEAVCDGAAGDLEDARGRQLPPCIVMEKGESLHDWSSRAEPDLFISLAVLANLSLRLADMHDAGYVHRDLKPANVMWLPRENRWTVIDFGCVARIGETAPLQFTVAYAAPEAIRCYFVQQHYIEASPALDAWSLGVMAFELLTGAPAFDLVSDGRGRVMQRLRGDLPLPWEGELSADSRRMLGAFREPVLQMLQRDPSRRMGMRTFNATCNKLFAARTTVEA